MDFFFFGVLISVEDGYDLIIGSWIYLFKSLRSVEHLEVTWLEYIFFLKGFDGLNLSLER